MRSGLGFDRARAACALVLALSVAPLSAHDLWIEPSSFAPQLGEVVQLRLQVGQNLAGEPLPLIPALVRRFAVDDAAGQRSVAARGAADPAGATRVVRSGLHVVAYHSHRSRVELAPDKFDAYLAEEGLDPIAALRAPRGGAPVRELFVRCAKSLLRVGPEGLGQGDRTLGLPLELVAERNPYALEDNEELPLRLTFDGAPLAGVLVVAINSLDPATKHSQRTDAEGRVRLRLRAGGLWLVKAVHMQLAPAGTDADRVSWWASLTFGS